MSRYDKNYDTSSSGSNGSGSSDYDDTEIKLQNYSTLRVDGSRVAAFNGTWGDKFVAGFENGAVLDGIVLQRDDKPLSEDDSTLKVFGFERFKGVTVNDDGVVVDEDTGDELTAQEVLDNPYVQTHDEEHGGDDYYYTPVGVVIEQRNEVAVNDDLDVETSEDPAAIEVGEISLMLGNKSWARKLGKLLTAEGEDFIQKEENENGEEVASRDDYGWMTTLEPDFREALDGRTMELFVVEDSFTPDDADEPITYTKPILLDSATQEPITVDNADPEASDDSDKTNNEAGQDAAESYDEPAADPEPEAATDGGTQAESSSDTDTESTDSPDEPDASDSEDAGEVPDVLDDLLDYFARTDGEDTTAEDIREMGADEVDDPDAVDWEAAEAKVHSRV